jgi:hypothetical protein
VDQLLGLLPDAEIPTGALARVGHALRATGYANTIVGGEGDGTTLARVALGHAVDRTMLELAIGPRDLTVLLEHGLLEQTGDTVESTMVLLQFGPAIAVVPLDHRRAADRVYLGPDTFWLADLVGHLAPGGERAADLGTGTGALAALLATRYDTVVAADLAPRALTCASLTLACSGLGPRSGVCMTDVALGLRAGAFDCVVANVPWVPGAVTEEGLRVVFADAGSGGFELPRRFLLEGAALLRAGGIMIGLALDFTTRDGSQPLLDVRRELERDGFSVAIIDTPAETEWPFTSARATALDPDIVTARHVAIVTRRPVR